MMTIIFQNYYATPLIRLSLRVIRSLVTTYQIYMKFCIVTNWRMAYIKMALINFSNLLCLTPIIRLLIRVISDRKVTCNYLSDLNKILYNEQLEDGEYRGDNYFSKFLCHAFN